MNGSGPSLRTGLAASRHPFGDVRREAKAPITNYNLTATKNPNIASKV